MGRFLDIEVTDGVAVVRLDRPDKGNSFTQDGHTEFATLWGRLEVDDAVRAVVLAANGKIFCAGPDHAYFAALTSPEGTAVRQRSMTETLQMVHGAIDFSKPVVTALHGAAFGSGLAFALLADVVIAERHVKILDGHVAAGIAAGDGGTLIWPLSMGLMKAKRHLLTGDPLTAEQAEQAGLVTEVVDTGASFERAMHYARRFADGPQLAIRSTKRALNQWMRQASIVSFHHGWALELLTMESPDASRAADEMRAGRGGVMPPDVPVVQG